MKKIFKNLFVVLFVLAVSAMITGCEWVDDYAHVLFKSRSYEDIFVDTIMSMKTGDSGWDERWKNDSEDDEKRYKSKLLLIREGSYKFNISGYTLENGKYKYGESVELPFSVRTGEFKFDAGCSYTIFFDETHAWLEGTE